MRKLKPATPGDLLLEEFLKPLAISQYSLAKKIGVPAQRIGRTVKGKLIIPADTDLRLRRFFGLSNVYWLRNPGRAPYRDYSTGFGGNNL
jgi:addiction module HigA family antidote